MFPVPPVKSWKLKKHIIMRNFTTLKEIEVVHLIKLYGGEGRKYPEVGSTQKYLE